MPKKLTNRAAVEHAIYGEACKWLVKADPKEQYDILVQVFKRLVADFGLSKPLAKPPESGSIKL